MLATVDTGILKNPLEKSHFLSWDVTIVLMLVAAVVVAAVITWRRWKRTHRPHAFTAIEVTIAIVIVGILAVVAIPIYLDVHEKALASEEAGIVGSVRSGLGTYAAESEVNHRTPRFPETLDDAGPGEATSANPFFTAVLDNKITADWSKIGLVYRGPAGNEYEYDPANGVFAAVVYPAGYVYGWSMDEGSGGGIGEGDYAGTISGATWVEGLSGTALKFDGDTGHVHIDDSDAIELTDAGTVQAWVNFDSMTPYAGIIHKGDAGDFSDETYTLQLWTGNTAILGLTDSSGNLHIVQTTTVFQPGQWYHVSATWDGSGMRMYVNGALETTNNEAVVARTSSGGLNIGSQTEGYYSSGWRNLPTQGTIDEAQIYNRALTATEIMAYYNSIPH